MNNGISYIIVYFIVIKSFLNLFEKVESTEYAKRDEFVFKESIIKKNNDYLNIFNFKEFSKYNFINTEKEKKVTKFPDLLSLHYLANVIKISKKRSKSLNNFTKSEINLIDYNEQNNDLFISLVDFLRSNIASDIINKSNIGETCKNKLESAYSKNNTYLYYLKIILDSTKSRNDVGSFHDCLSNDYGFNIDLKKKNLEYVVVNYDKVQTDDFIEKGHPNFDLGNYENGFFIFGMCIIQGCNETEIQEILKVGNEKISILEKFEKEDLKIYSLKSEYLIKNKEDLLLLIPLIIILFQLIIIIFPSIPGKLISCCTFRLKKVTLDSFHDINDEKFFKIKENNLNNYKIKIIDSEEILNTNYETNEKSNSYNVKYYNYNQNFKSIMNQIYNSYEKPNDCLILNETYEKNLNKLKKIFSLKINIKDLFLINFSKENINPTYDFSSLGYVTGIRGIAMFSIIIGYVYLIISKSPIKIYCKFTYFKLIKSTLYNIISSGIRISPRILLACSGYILAFKILNYFDKKLKNLQERDCEDKFFDENNFIFYQDNKKSLYNHSENINSNSEKKNFTNNGVPFKYLISFLMKQFHKYLLYILTLIFFKFCLYKFFALYGKVGPIWHFFKNNVIDSFNFKQLLYQILLFDSVADFKYLGKNYIYLFWLISLEIKFFIFTSCLIYLAYRINFRFDIFIFAFIPIIISAKIIFYFSSKYLLSIDFYPTIFYNLNLYNFISITPYYNYSYYLIGVMFGTINYIHQKSLSYYEIRKFNKTFLILPLKCYNLLLNFHHSRRKIIKFSKLFLILLGIFIAFSQKLFMILMGFTKLEDMNDNYFKNDFLNCYYLIDKDLFIIILFFVCSGIARTESNFLSSILESNFWIFKNKIYFGYMMTMNLVIFYLSYQSESRIKIEFFNVLFLSIVCYMILFINSSLFYIFFDAPYKKLNRYLLKEKLF